MVDVRLIDERNYLRRAIDRDREELRQALEGLKVATMERVETLRVGHHIALRPAPWIFGGFLFGLWLGWSRTEDL
ncbi:MAG: hypothetical protein KF878_07275 [Planctomycetes bacterium]|nr:hypothetical protein [Planctomycetota bacterium]